MDLEHSATLQERRPHAASGAGIATLDSVQMETLTLNLDAALRVYTRTQFFAWTQGLLQSLVPHDVLICAQGGAGAQALRVDSFSSLAPDAALFGELFQRDATAASLLKAWEDGGELPVSCRAQQGAALCGGLLGRELERLGATQLLAHGSRGADGHLAAFFVFAGRPRRAGENDAYLLQLALPSLHFAWTRTRAEGGLAAGARAGAADAGVLTLRELEILRWIYLGKSNFEVGAILRISPLTVKNHVQKILRKLNVVNRTQAVGKALESRLLTP
ncbi:MAG TPA: helix-turn-helix transcriptional regulator [Burkholderiales bacterium]|nr:helix-turn-helix transcriptional regulator [Burkholderiales bacterium]